MQNDHLRTVFTAEFINATSGVYDLLLARVERMARGTNFNVQLVFQRGTRNKFVSTAAGNLDFLIIGMNFGFHYSHYLAGSTARGTGLKGGEE